MFKLLLLSLLSLSLSGHVLAIENKPKRPAHPQSQPQAQPQAPVKIAPQPSMHAQPPMPQEREREFIRPRMRIPRPAVQVPTQPQPAPEQHRHDVSPAPKAPVPSTTGNADDKPRVRIPLNRPQVAQEAKPTAKGFVPPIIPVAKPQPGQMRPGNTPASDIHTVQRINTTRVDFAKTRTENVMKNDVHVTQIVNQQSHNWVTNQRPIIVQHAPVFRGFVNQYARWRHDNSSFLNRWWFRHRFFGGCYYGFNPIFDISLYFYNPLVYWFYAPTYEVRYYRTWYGDDIDAYPDFDQPFEYNGLFYPTENLRQLLFSVSAMPIDDQVAFRQAMGLFTRKLAQKIANATGSRAHLSQGDIVVTHYAILRYDGGVSLDGFVNQNGNAYNFKGIVDLRDPGTSQVFVVPNMDLEPTDRDLNDLENLNQQIADAGGEVVPDDEPLPPEPVAPAELNAEPEEE